MPFKNFSVREVVTEQDNGSFVRRQVLGGDVPPVLAVSPYDISTMIYRVWDDFEAAPGDYYWSGMNGSGNVVSGYVVNDASVFETLNLNGLGVAVAEGRELLYAKSTDFVSGGLGTSQRLGRGLIFNRVITASTGLTAVKATIQSVTGHANFFDDTWNNRVWEIYARGGTNGTVQGWVFDLRVEIWRNGVMIHDLEWYRQFNNAGFVTGFNVAMHCFVDPAFNAIAREFRLTLRPTAGSVEIFAIPDGPFEWGVRDVGTADNFDITNMPAI